ncbi:MAG: hypothetical protein COV47_00350 [Candidatus Diapherotrites archaeon CG11_big_fil_rev_8_21_14_0_20_37_9]|nr:MAG: hypothetical protein COV47_00350 [Candidatus Diapherotrites archaeon CG11_big_fil_rev_8_21_14_0_20_37_9]
MPERRPTQPKKAQIIEISKPKISRKERIQAFLNKIRNKLKGQKAEVIDLKKPLREDGRVPKRKEA